jgi:sugar phosphate permease
LLGLPGFFDITSQAYFYFAKSIIGIFNALLFPSMVAILGNWISKKNRGLLIGLWATCNNFGNIVGIQFAALLMRLFEGHWGWLQVVVGITAAVMSVIIFFFLEPEPARLGITIEELTERE